MVSNWKEKLKERTLATTANRDNKNMGKKSILAMDKINFPIWKPKCGYMVKNEIDIMPWKVSQKWYEKLHAENGQCHGFKPGDFDYKLELPIHYQIGPNKEPFICLQYAFGGSDAICEARNEEFEKQNNNDSTFNKDKAVKLYPKWRDFYIVYDYNDPDKGYQLFESSYKLFEEYLLKAMAVFTEEIVPWHPEEGYILKFGMKEDTFQGNKFYEVNGDIEFIKREDEISEEDLESLPSLDAAVTIPTHEEIRDAFFGMVEESYGNEKPFETSQPENKRVSRRSIQKTDQPKEEEPQNQEDEMPDWDKPTKCPHNYKFGTDCNSKQECNDCDDTTYDACESEHHLLNEKVQEIENNEDPEPEPEQEKPVTSRRRRR